MLVGVISFNRGRIAVDTWRPDNSGPRKVVIYADSPIAVRI
jgi:hypothetical protein